MYLKPDYDVLRLIQHNGMCHVSSDNVEGCPLEKWLKFHPYMSKAEVIKWILEIVRQLSKIHKCHGNPEYQYVNPYSIIVTKDKSLCFLDICSDSNKEYILMMQNQCIQKFFVPKQSMYKQMSSEERDIFGLGKTIQYLLAFSEVTPAFSKMEELRLQRMIAKCTDSHDKKKFRKVDEVQKYLADFAVK